MSDAFAAIWSAIPALLGIAVFATIIWLIAKSHAHMWRRVSAVYREHQIEPSIARRIETIVVAQRGAMEPLDAIGSNRQYAGTILSVASGGLRLSLIPIPPLNMMAPAVFLPFDEMTLDPTSWALWPQPYALRMRNLPEIDIILGRDAVDWIRSQANQSPFGSSV